MYAKKIVKITLLNTAIAVVDTILLSPGLLGIQIGGASILETALGATTVFMSVMVFVTGNYKLLLGKEKTIQPREIKTRVDCINALKRNHDKKTFENDIETIFVQIERFHKKKETIKDILLQKFNITEMSYSKFDGVIVDIENVFYINIKSIVNKLNAFDEEDYKHILKEDVQKKFTKEFIVTKMSIYNEFISFVKEATQDNEQIILKLDKLLLEISKFDSLEDGELESMSAFKEIDELITKTRLYK